MDNIYTYIQICLPSKSVTVGTMYTKIFDFIKTNHQYNTEMLIKLHNIFINLGILYGIAVIQ